MTGFAVPGWLVIVLGIGTAIGIAIAVIRVIRAQPKYDWQPLPGYPGAQFIAPPGVSAERVANCLDYAVSCLLTFGHWSAADLLRVAKSMRIFVADDVEWVDAWGRKIAGYQEGNTLVVGRDLAALPHELGHKCETDIDGSTDETHETWKSNGIAAAIAEYVRWLTKNAETNSI